jgi:hypothetical protein
MFDCGFAVASFIILVYDWGEKDIADAYRANIDVLQH